MPFLKEIKFDWNAVNENCKYPFNITSIQGLSNIRLQKKVPYFAGENGSGKSTVLEAIAHQCGFSINGGSKRNIRQDNKDNLELANIIRLSWMPKVTNGFFLRAETYSDYTNYIDEMLSKEPLESREKFLKSYGGKPLNHQSHGESFLSLFANRFKRKGLYLLDEPESALSPSRQLMLLRILWDIINVNMGQFIIATHSPILLAFPDAELHSFDSAPIKKIPIPRASLAIRTKQFILI